MCHKNIHDGVADLAGTAFTPTHLRDDPLIFAGCAVKRPKENPARSKAKSSIPQLEATEQKGDLLIRDLWNNGTESVHDMRVMNNDAKLLLEKTPEKSLQESEQANKKMYLEACLQQRRHFPPFVASVDGLTGCGGVRYPENYIQLLRKKVAAALIQDVYIGQDYDCHHFVAGFTPMHPGVQGADPQHQRPSPAVGRRRQAEPVQVSTL